jgi:hypothetical protein
LLHCEHDADDVLADVVHVALDRRHHDLALARHALRLRSLLGLDEGHQVRDRLLHHARLFTTCGRNILPAPNRSPTTFMPSISGPSMTSSGRPPSARARASSVSASMKSVMPLTSACSERSSTGPSRQARGPRAALPPPPPLERLGELSSSARSRRAAVEDHVLDALAQLGSISS